MLKNLLGMNKKRTGPLPLPKKERSSKTVPTRRFNDMIDYYTNEIKSRLEEIQRLKEENEMLIKTSIRNAARSDENRLQAKKLGEDVRVLQTRLKEKK